MKAKFLLAVCLMSVCDAHTRFWKSYNHTYDEDLNFARKCFGGCMNNRQRQLYTLPSEERSHWCCGECTEQCYQQQRRIFKLSGMWHFEKLHLPGECL